jgi:hypothetical protein
MLWFQKALEDLRTAYFLDYPSSHETTFERPGTSPTLKPREVNAMASLVNTGSGPLGPTIVTAVFLTSIATASAFELQKVAYSGGAFEAGSGSFMLRATVGEAGIVGAVTGGSFQLGEGFWAGIWRLTATDVSEEGPAGDSEIRYANAFRQNFPNPFGAWTVLAFSVAEESSVEMVIFNVQGRRVATVTDGILSPGRYEARWDGRDGLGRFVAAGVYFARLQIGEWSETKKMLRVR